MNTRPGRMAGHHTLSIMPAGFFFLIDQLGLVHFVHGSSIKSS